MAVRRWLRKAWHRTRPATPAEWAAVTSGPVRFDPSLRTAAQIVSQQTL